MTSPAIRIDGLWKEYVIGGRQSSGQSFRETVTDLLTTPFRRLAGQAPAEPEEDRFWALRDVSFEVQPGEVVGIIGRNGAGKSTLLKILSRITAPTKGGIEINGRIASLLEVGTGFHAELTGRENVFLNGAILGMTRAEIRSKFDEIVDFSGVEKFIDTPVKRYSSGMQVRLAFAVAAHLDPEILLVDEVLAVGDAEFQKKCLNKMEGVVESGRTILFVSHNMSSVRLLCKRGVMLSSGSVASIGPIEEVTQLYLKDNETQTLQTGDAPSHATACIASVEATTASLTYGDSLKLHCAIVARQEMSAGIEVEVHDELEGPLIYASTAPMYGEEIPLAVGVNYVDLTIGPLPLARGRYSVYLWLIKPWTEEYHRMRTPVMISVDLSDPGGSGFDFRQSYGRGAIAVPVRFGITKQT